MIVAMTKARYVQVSTSEEVYARRMLPTVAERSSQFAPVHFPAGCENIYPLISKRSDR
jgi:hypothetical protein